MRTLTTTGTTTSTGGTTAAASKPKPFYGSATVDTARMGRDTGEIATEVVAPPSSRWARTSASPVEIEADHDGGFDTSVFRIV